MKPTFKNCEKCGRPADGRIQTGPAVLLMLALLGSGRISPLVAEDNAPPSVSGVVTAEDTGKPIAHALVRVSSPAVDMRSQHGQDPGLYDGLTDADGRFTIQVPGSEKISLNAYAPGYEEAAGMWMSGNWTHHNIPFPSNHEPKINLKLRPAVYVTGIVTDDSGRPFPGADVESAIEGKYSTAYVAFDTTAANGRFEIFDFPLHPVAFDGNTKAYGRLTFRNSTKLTSSIQNIYALSAVERTNLHVTLSSGHELRGIITSAIIRSNQWQPPANTVVEVVPADKNAAQRVTISDEDGRFLVRALPDGEVSVRVHTPSFDQKTLKTVQLAGADMEVNLRLEPVVYKHPPNPVSVLGLTLANVTPELQAVYDLDSATGVLILDPGTNHLRLGMGELSQGESFWIVGEKEIKDLPAMVAEVLRIDAIAPPGDPNEGCHGSIRVVYNYRNGAGTMTQRLTLTDEDRAELKRICATISP